MKEEERMKGSSKHKKKILPLTYKNRDEEKGAGTAEKVTEETIRFAGGMTGEPLEHNLSQEGGREGQE